MDTTAVVSAGVTPPRGRSRLAGAFRHKSLAIGVALIVIVLAVVIIGPFLNSHNRTP